MVVYFLHFDALLMFDINIWWWYCSTANDGHTVSKRSLALSFLDAGGSIDHPNSFRFSFSTRIGENDYTQGASGQWLMEQAMAASGSTQTNNHMSGWAHDDCFIPTTEEDEETGGTVVNYGLNQNRFKIYSNEGWLTYNKSFLQLPISVSDAIERNRDSNGFANLTLVFDNADGTTDRVSAVEFTRNAESDIFYNPYGQRVKADAKGIVISNGKKIFNR